MTAWIGPDIGGERADGTPGTVLPQHRIWMRLFGVACAVCGAIVLATTFLGLWGPGAEGQSTP